MQYIKRKLSKCTFDVSKFKNLNLETNMQKKSLKVTFLANLKEHLQLYVYYIKEANQENILKYTNCLDRRHLPNRKASLT